MGKHVCPECLRRWECHVGHPLDPGHCGSIMTKCKDCNEEVVVIGNAAS